MAHSIEPIITEKSIGQHCSRIWPRVCPHAQAYQKPSDNSGSCYEDWIFPPDNLISARNYFPLQVRHPFLCPYSCLNLALIHFLSLHRRAALTLTQLKLSASGIRLLSRSRFYLGLKPSLPVVFHKQEALVIPASLKKISLGVLSELSHPDILLYFSKWVLLHTYYPAMIVPSSLPSF